MEEWKKELQDVVQKRDSDLETRKEGLDEARAATKTFFSEIVKPAFEELKVELEGKYGRKVNMYCEEEEASIKILGNNRVDFDYSILVRIHPSQATPYTVIGCKNISKGEKGSLSKKDSGEIIDDVLDVTKLDILHDVIKEYKSCSPF